MKVRYIGPFSNGTEDHPGGVELLDGTWFAAGVDEDVTPELARGLLAQPDNFAPSDAEAQALAAELFPEPEKAPPTPPPTPAAPSAPVPPTPAPPAEVAAQTPETPEVTP